MTARPMQYQIEITVEKLVMQGLAKGANLSVAWQRGSKVVTPEEEVMVDEQGRVEWKHCIIHQMCTMYISNNEKYLEKPGKLTIRQRVWSKRRGTHYIGLGTADLDLADFIGISSLSTTRACRLMKCSDSSAEIHIVIRTSWMKNMNVDDDSVSMSSMDSSTSTSTIDVCSFSPRSMLSESSSSSPWRKSRPSFDFKVAEEETHAMTVCRTEKKNTNPFCTSNQTSLNSRTKIDHFDSTSTPSTMSKRPQRKLVNPFDIVAHPEPIQEDIEQDLPSQNSPLKSTIDRMKQRSVTKSESTEEEIRDSTLTTLSSRNQVTASGGMTPTSSVDNLQAVRQENKALKIENQELMKELIATKLALAQVKTEIDVLRFRSRSSDDRF